VCPCSCLSALISSPSPSFSSSSSSSSSFLPLRLSRVSMFHHHLLRAWSFLVPMLERLSALQLTSSIFGLGGVALVDGACRRVLY
jgi:hypothetical protein